MAQGTGRLSDKVAIVTGASSGIGRVTAKLFAAEGAKVVVGARRESELASLVDEIKASGGTAVSLAGDVRSEDYAKALVALAVKAFGRLDIAFNNAGTLVSEDRRKCSLWITSGQRVYIRVAKASECHTHTHFTFSRWCYVYIFYT